MSSFSLWYNSIFHTLHAPRPPWRIHNPRAQPRPPRASFFPGSPSPSSRVTWLGAEVSYGVKASKPGYSITPVYITGGNLVYSTGLLAPRIARRHGTWNSLGATARSYRRQDGADTAARFEKFLPAQIYNRETRMHGTPCTKTTDSYLFSFFHNNPRKILRETTVGKFVRNNGRR